MKHAISTKISRAMLTIGSIALVLFVAGSCAYAQTYTVLYDFGTKNGEPSGASDSGIVAQGRDGNMYSTAPGTKMGTVFKITPAGALTVLHRFTGTDGEGSASGLTLGTDGNFYGTTAGGGAFSSGTIFTISPTGKRTTLYSFTGLDDGGDPVAPPIEGIDGNFYGTTGTGGSVGANGTVYKITPAGVFSTLFSLGGSFFGFSNGPLVQGSDGFLYGTSTYGGVNVTRGMIFKTTFSGDFTDLFDFNFDDGEAPIAPLVENSDGNFYGDTAAGGADPDGVIFKITPTGSFTQILNFGCCQGGAFGGMVLATDGNFYGTTYDGTVGGGIFRLTPSGEYTVLYTFTCATGCLPMVTPLQHTDGKLYGDTSSGGSKNHGVFYSFDLGLAPFVRLVPQAAAYGSTAGILGQGFTGTTGVSFNGTPAAFKVSSDTFLTATVPAGATSGPVTVSTPAGVLTSNRSFLISTAAASLNLSSVAYPTPPMQGGLVTYAFKVWNQSSVDAVHEVLVTQVPAGTTFSSIALSGTAGLGSCTAPPVGSAGAVVCKENSVMRPGSTWTIRLTVKITAPAGTVLAEGATASSDNAISTTATMHNTVR